MTISALTSHQEALLQTALAVRAGGVSLVPVSGATKKPLTGLLPIDPDTNKPGWKEYQTRLPTEDEIVRWVEHHAQIAMVTGGISGGALVADFDEQSKWPAWQALAQGHYEHLPMQRTGGGGYQIAWRTAQPGKNDKLAWMSDPTKFDGRRIAIETRGEGGYAIIAPSMHPSGGFYTMLSGSFAQIPLLSQTQSDMLLGYARQLCEAPYTLQQLQMMNQAMQQPSQTRAHANGSVSVIDAWNQATPIETVLRDVGYTHCYQDRWAPPGSSKQRDSVIVKNGKAYHHDTDFPLADGFWHDAFDVWQYYRHNGDVKAACREAAVILCLPSIPASSVQPAPSPPNNPPPPPVNPQPAQAFHPLLLDAPQTDAGNAECFAALYGDQFRYCRNLKQWLSWQQTHWQPDANSIAWQTMLKTIRERRLAAGLLSDPDAAKKLFAWTYTSEMTNKRDAALKAAAHLQELTTVINDYDRDITLLGLPNGVLDLQALTYRPAVQADMITMQLGTLYDPQATCPRWLRFMQEITGGDSALVVYMQRAVGYSLTGSTIEQNMFLLYGDGRNGKSTFLNVLSRLMGDYAGNTAFEMLDAERRSDSTSDLAALKGKRFVTIIESDQDRYLAEARVKVATGKDPIHCRFLYCEPFDYYPHFKIWMAMNHLPKIRGTDEGIWRRIQLIPFLQRFADDKQDKNLEAALLAELPGILNWALAGLQEWQQHGLGEPPSVKEATAGYRKASDVVGEFLDEYCVVEQAEQINGVELYELFFAWSKSRGEMRPMSAIAFGRTLNSKGHKTERKTVKDMTTGLARKQPFYAGLRRRQELDP